MGADAHSAVLPKRQTDLWIIRIMTRPPPLIKYSAFCPIFFDYTFVRSSLGASLSNADQPTLLRCCVIFRFDTPSQAPVPVSTRSGTKLLLVDQAYVLVSGRVMFEIIEKMLQTDHGLQARLLGWCRRKWLSHSWCALSAI